MRKMNRWMAGIVLLISLLAAISLPVSAEEVPCSLTVRLEDDEKQGIDGVEIQICRVADAALMPIGGFESAGIAVSGLLSATDGQNAEKLAAYAKDHKITPLRQTTHNGTAAFSGLAAGIWLVYSEDTQYTFNPYTLLLPYTAEGKVTHDVVSSPKVAVKLPDNKSIYVVKKWNDEANAAGKRPESVTVRLLRDDAEIASVILSEANGWSHLFEKMADTGVYRVEEQAVALYTTHYSGDAANGFVVTNTYQPEKLPQTGRLWWPIAILAVAGFLLILLGVLELRAKKHEKT